MKFDHVIWTFRLVNKGCYISRLFGFDNKYQITLGTPLLESFPADATFKMKPTFPKNTITPDNLKSFERLVSTPMCDFLRSKELRNVEFLPVTVLNHRGRPVKPPYHIVHPIHAIDCLDDVACGITFDDPPDNDYIEEVENFVLDPDKCDDFPAIFRVKRMGVHIMVHRQLAKELDEAGFTGNGWIEPSRIGGMWLGGGPMAEPDDDDDDDE